MHQFRIIDYGLADFKELFGAGYVRSNNSHRHKRKARMYRGTSLGKMAVPVTDDDQAEATGTTEEGYMRAARPIGCVAFLPHPSNLLPQVHQLPHPPPCACLNRLEFDVDSLNCCIKLTSAC